MLKGRSTLLGLSSGALLVILLSGNTNTVITSPSSPPDSRELERWDEQKKRGKIEGVGVSNFLVQAGRRSIGSRDENM